MRLLNYLIAVSLALVLSCNPSSTTMVQQKMADTVITNRVIKFAGDSIMLQNSRALFLHNVSKAMGMSDISQSVSDLSLRIWLWDESVKYVINLEKKGSHYSCDAIGFNAKQTDSGQIIIIHNE